MELVLIVAVLVAAIAANAIEKMMRRRKLRRSIAAAFGVRATGETNPYYAASFWRAYERKEKISDALDDATWDDLELDAVFAAVNSCGSAVGDLWLYAALRTRGAVHGAEWDDLLTAFEGNEQLRLDAQMLFHALGHSGGTCLETVLFSPERLRLPKSGLLLMLAVFPLLTVFVWPFSGVAAGLTLTVLTAVVNFGLTLYLRSRTGSGFVSVCRFLSVLGCAKRLAPRLRKTLPEAARALEHAAKRFDSLGLPASVIRFGDVCMQMGVPDLSAVLLLPVVSYLWMIRRMERRSQDACALVLALGEVDAAISILSLQKMLPYWSKPEFTEKLSMEFTDAYHPLLENPVPSSARFDRGALFTGSNASGKSTFIKTAALNCLFGQSFGLCFARRFRAARALLLSSMTHRDDILASESYFTAELRRVRSILETVRGGRPCLVFVDELLRGTNTLERISACWAVLRALSDAGALVLAATHDLEQTRLLSDRFDNFHFGESFEDGQVRFDYTLRAGPTRTRNALALMRAMDYPDAVCDGADLLLRSFETTGTWAAPEELRLHSPGKNAIIGAKERGEEHV